VARRRCVGDAHISKLDSRIQEAAWRSRIRRARRSLLRLEGVIAHMRSTRGQRLPGDICVGSAENSRRGGFGFSAVWNSVRDCRPSRPGGAWGRGRCADHLSPASGGVRARPGARYGGDCDLLWAAHDWAALPPWRVRRRCWFQGLEAAAASHAAARLDDVTPHVDVFNPAKSGVAA